MKARKISAICFACTLLLCGCGETEQAATDITIDLPENIQVSMKDNPYFDTSDLSYAGKMEQNIAIGYEFENPEDNNPVITYDKYYSDDGEVFCFDAWGRLCQYKYTEVFGVTGTVKGNSEAAGTRYTREEKQELCRKIAASCLNETATLEVTAQDDSNYCVTNENTVADDESPFTALIQMGNTGEIFSFDASYNSLTSAVDKAYFEEKLNAYLDGIRSQYDLYNFDYSARYAQIDNKIYAMYNCEFEYNYDPIEGSGPRFCETVGFTKEIEPDSGDIDS